MTKSKMIAAIVVTIATAVTTATTTEAHARPRFGVGLGIGIAAGAIIGAAAATSAYAGPAYVVEPGYRECRYVERYDRWGNLRTVRVCDVVPY